MTVDLRRVNSITKPTAWPVFDIESISTRLSQARVFSTLDADNGYWQLPLAKQSQSIYSIMLPHGVYSSTRCLQGSINGTAWFQASMNYIFGHLVSSQVDINIDDLLAHTADIDSHFVLLREIFDRARRHRLKFAVHKTRLFHSETKFCGKLYSAAGIRHDPERINGVLELPEPSTAAELMQFLCSLNRMRSSIMRYSELTHPLQHLLNHCLSLTT